MLNTIKSLAQLIVLIYMAAMLLLTMGESLESATVILCFAAAVLPLFSRNFRLLYMRAFRFCA